MPSVDFLLRDGNHDRLPYGKRSFQSREYGRWMARLWELYVADPEPTPIEFLDNMVRGMFGAETTKEGSGIASYGILVVETDGTITKNDTLKNSFDGADLFCRNWSVHRNSFVEITGSAEYLQYVTSQRTNHRECLECQLLPACRRRNDAAPLVRRQGIQQPVRLLYGSEIPVKPNCRYDSLDSHMSVVPDFDWARSHKQPFRHAWIPRLFPSTSNDRIVEWLEQDIPWKFTKKKFYRQFEFSLKDVPPPADLDFLLADKTLAAMVEWLREEFDSPEIEPTDVVAHLLESGHGIGSAQ